VDEAVLPLAESSCRLTERKGAPSRPADLVARSSVAPPGRVAGRPQQTSSLVCWQASRQLLALLRLAAGRVTVAVSRGSERHLFLTCRPSGYKW
jgi:hypothetical protein